MAWLVFLAASAIGAGTNGFQCDLIVLPGHPGVSHFADIDNDGRLDLLAVDPVEQKLLIFRQRLSGFTNAPDQVVELPPQTAWIVLYDVDAHPGLELLLSTATGLVYHRQNRGVFESERHTLFKAEQVFTNADPPILISLAANAAIPVISATNEVLHRRNSAFAWDAGQSMALEVISNQWFGYHNDWNMGPNPSYHLRVHQTLRSKSNVLSDGKPDSDTLAAQVNAKGVQFLRADDKQAENDSLRKLIAEMKKAGPRHQPGINRVDLNGDGQKDLVLWQILGDFESRTDVYVFLRGADGTLPERPSQILHCRGFPIPVGSPQQISPIGDLKGDGTYALVLLDVKSTIASVSSVVEMALSRGLDLTLTIRSSNRGLFARSPDAALSVTAIMPVESMGEWPLFLWGDFNGDGRLDFVVRRATTQWNIYLSTDDGHWFKPQPAMTFEKPMPGYFDLADLNGDGRSDIVLRAKDDARIFIFLSQSQPMKGRNP